jgi:hypothetical protein
VHNDAYIRKQHKSIKIINYPALTSICRAQSQVIARIAVHRADEKFNRPVSLIVIDGDLIRSRSCCVSFKRYFPGSRRPPNAHSLPRVCHLGVAQVRIDGNAQVSRPSGRLQLLSIDPRFAEYTKQRIPGL